jgi:hypothetical protein
MENGVLVNLSELTENGNNPPILTFNGLQNVNANLARGSGSSRMKVEGKRSYAALMLGFGLSLLPEVMSHISSKGSL